MSRDKRWLSLVVPLPDIGVKLQVTDTTVIHLFRSVRRNLLFIIIINS